jgi:hypothetical protein
VKAAEGDGLLGRLRDRCGYFGVAVINGVVAALPFLMPQCRKALLSCSARTKWRLQFNELLRWSHLPIFSVINSSLMIFDGKIGPNFRWSGMK